MVDLHIQGLLAPVQNVELKTLRTVSGTGQGYSMILDPLEILVNPGHTQTSNEHCLSFSLYW